MKAAFAVGALRFNLCFNMWDNEKIVNDFPVPALPFMIISNCSFSRCFSLIKSNANFCILFSCSRSTTGVSFSFSFSSPANSF